MERWLPIPRRPGVTSRPIPSCSRRDSGPPLAMAFSTAAGGGDPGDRALGPCIPGRPGAGARRVSAAAAVRRRLLDARRGGAPRAAVDCRARAGRCRADRGSGLRAAARRWLTVGGLGIGVGLGLLTRWLLAIVPHPAQVAITVVTAYAGYLLAGWIGASGLLAVIAMSLILGTAFQPATHHQVHRFWRRLGFFMSSAIFLLVGLQVRLDEVMQVGARLLVLVVAVLLARTLMVIVATLPRADLWPWRWRLGLVWAGLRGALSLALALGVPASVTGQGEILTLVFGFV